MSLHGRVQCVTNSVSGPRGEVGQTFLTLYFVLNSPLAPPALPGPILQLGEQRYALHQIQEAGSWELGERPDQIFNCMARLQSTAPCCTQLHSSAMRPTELHCT